MPELGEFGQEYRRVFYEWQGLQNRRASDPNAELVGDLYDEGLQAADALMETLAEQGAHNDFLEAATPQPDPYAEKRRAYEGMRGKSDLITDDMVDAKLATLPPPPEFSDEDREFATGYLVVRSLTAIFSTPMRQGQAVGKGEKPEAALHRPVPAAGSEAAEAPAPVVEAVRAAGEITYREALLIAHHVVERNDLLEYLGFERLDPAVVEGLTELDDQQDAREPISDERLRALRAKAYEVLRGCFSEDTLEPLLDRLGEDDPLHHLIVYVYGQTADDTEAQKAFERAMRAGFHVNTVEEKDLNERRAVSRTYTFDDSSPPVTIPYDGGEPVEGSGFTPRTTQVDEGDTFLGTDDLAFLSEPEAAVADSVPEGEALAPETSEVEPDVATEPEAVPAATEAAPAGGSGERKRKRRKGLEEQFPGLGDSINQTLETLRLNDITPDDGKTITSRRSLPMLGIRPRDIRNASENGVIPEGDNNLNFRTLLTLAIYKTVRPNGWKVREKDFLRVIDRICDRLTAQVTR